jgi:hypothetical protein
MVWIEDGALLAYDADLSTRTHTPHIAAHRIVSHRIASHRIASHRIAWHVGMHVVTSAHTSHHSGPALIAAFSVS